MGVMAELFERAMAVRSAVLGRAHVERARQRTIKFTEDWQTFITHMPGARSGQGRGSSVRRTAC
jgi:hypothetical protein